MCVCVCVCVCACVWLTVLAPLRRRDGAAQRHVGRGAVERRHGVPPLRVVPDGELRGARLRLSEAPPAVPGTVTWPVSSGVVLQAQVEFTAVYGWSSGRSKGVGTWVSRGYGALGPVTHQNTEPHKLVHLYLFNF